MKRTLSFGALTIIAFSLASCAAAAQDSPTASNSPSIGQELPTELLLSDGGKKAVVHSGTSTAPRVEAEIRGRLDNDGAGCFIVRADDGDDYTLVFPEGTRFDGESLVLPDSSSFSEGDAVSLSGARVPANESLSMCLNYARLLSVDVASVAS
ncbi:hypothetical protein [Escherichia coli]|uniref:hypothetical protein n=1 Tax=Escherichia coli TaxID=562 RepID=UPI0032E3B653